MSTTTTPTTLTGTYTIDPTHSRIGFVARHAMVTKVRGSFNEFEGTGYFDTENPAGSHLQLTIQAASIDTRNADRDGHLASNDFFDMETYPEITLRRRPPSSRSTTTTTGSPATSPSRASPSPSRSTSSTPAPPSTRTATTRVGFEGKTTVNRKDWGVNWNAALEAGGVLVSEKVTLEFEVSAIRTADAA